MCCWLFFVFFFQAEDGIRDLTVTGVQTCALPISTSLARFRRDTRRNRARLVGVMDHTAEEPTKFRNRGAWNAEVRLRSEERRVGKECRARWAQYHERNRSMKQSVDGHSDAAVVAG